MPNIIEPVNCNFTKGNGLAIYQNAVWSVPVSVWTRENLVDTPFDLTGYTGVMEVKEKADYDSTLFSPEVIIEGNVITLYLSSEKSKNIVIEGENAQDTKTWVYTVDLTDAEGTVYRALQGNVEVSPSVIKNTIDNED